MSDKSGDLCLVESINQSVGRKLGPKSLDVQRATINQRIIVRNPKKSKTYEELISKLGKKCYCFQVY